MKGGLFFCTSLFLILVLPLFVFSHQPEMPVTGTIPSLPASAATDAPAAAFYIPNAPIAVWELGEYEGEFLEGNSDEPVCCACLIIENTADKMLEYVCLRLGQLRFVASCIPPKARILILEQNKLKFTNQSLELAGCEAYTFADETPQNRVYVSTGGERDILVTNLTDEVIPSVCIRYKQYSPESGLYWGGITYSIEIKDLQPEQSLSVSPYRFLSHRSKLIDVKTENKKPES